MFLLIDCRFCLLQGLEKKKYEVKLHDQLEDMEVYIVTLQDMKKQKILSIFYYS